VAGFNAPLSGRFYAPRDKAFAFLDAIVADGGLRYHTAGALGKGERIWMLAKLPGHVRVNGTDDVTEKYLLLSNSHNGTSALRVLFTPIRVVCANTLAVAHHRGAGQGISILHKGDLAAKVRQAQTVLGLAHRFYDDLEGHMNRLAGYYPSTEQLTTFFKSLYPDPVEGGKTRAKNTRQELFRLFEEGRGQDIYAIRHSAWAAYHALTEYVDHHRPTRARTPQDRAALRLQSQWFGSGAKLKAKAWDLALAIRESN
jgi:phage/plasmid-like protein (TIGR03299 family)